MYLNERRKVHRAGQYDNSNVSITRTHGIRATDYNLSFLNVGRLFCNTRARSSRTFRNMPN